MCLYLQISEKKKCESGDKDEMLPVVSDEDGVPVNSLDVMGDCWKRVSVKSKAA